ncbi:MULTISPECIES: M35 family metallo-endopeptidase [Pseudacidovorax]|uniref:M35 family metallo-endopeptidase n=1 Tax=Pseudacidovorax TaxID=433923 RepID=UPI001F253E91|nr:MULTISPECIES: M35 family metallo-endopeptidase [Pseudacidovorax]
MPYTVNDLYTTRHGELIENLKDGDFPSSTDWVGVISDSRAVVTARGYNTDKYAACESLRSRVKAGAKKSVKPVATMMTAAGVTSLPSAGSKAIPAGVSKRVAALEMLRHLWMVKKSGSHKLWVLSLPEAYKDWPAEALKGKDYDALGHIVNDESSHFSAEDRKHLGQSSQNGLRWIQKAMVVCTSPDKKKHMAILRRWFADANTKDEDLKAVAATLNEGLKGMAASIRSNFLLIADMPKDRGSDSSRRTNAFVFSNEAIDVIYVEGAFFGKNDTFQGLKNWTRIVVHELSHRVAKTADHRYRHHAKGLKPDAADPNFTGAKAQANADSWAMFCMDCAGEMTKGDYTKVQVSE